MMKSRNYQKKLSMNKYLNYKETDSDWVESIPSEWKFIRGRFLFKAKKELNSDLQCKNLLSLTLSGVLNKDFHSNDGLRPENYSSYQIFQQDDLVFKMIDLENVNTSRVGLVPEEGIMSPVYLRHEPIKTKIDPKFAYWFYYDLYKKEIYNSIGSGVRSSLSSSDLLEIELPVPPLKDQKLISQYLDKKTEQIDHLVEKIQKKINFLEEQRTSLISHYVTKGLDPNVEMKDSGIEWIGQIPNHWGVKKLKHFAKIYGRIGYRGYTVDDIVSEGKGAITLGPGNIKDNKLNLLQRTYISNKKYEESPEIQIFPEDIIFVKTGSTIGKSCIVEDQLDKMTLNPQMVVLKDILINNKFFFYQTITQFFQNFFETEKAGGSTPTISQEKIRDFPMLNVPVNEQEEITNYLNLRIKKIEDLIILNEQKIMSINEYRQSLISSVVTGKVRVTKDMI